MEWVILFGTSWILFFLLLDYKRWKVNIWGGVMAVVLQLMVDSNAMTHGLYAVNRPVLQVFRSSVFFVMGPIFVIGVLLAQYHPYKRWMRIVNVFVLTTLYSTQELLLLQSGALQYKNWHFMDSLIVNVSAMIILSWFAMTILEKKGLIGI